MHRWEISVRINLSFYLFFQKFVCFFSVGLPLLIQHFQQVLWVLKFLLSPGLGSWQLEFKSLIIVIVIWTPRSTAQTKQQTKFWKPTITIISDLNPNCQLPKLGDRRNSNTHKTCWKCCINNERPTEKKHTNVVWDDGVKIGKIIN